MPNVVAVTDHVLVTEWMDGTPLSKIINEGSQEERDRAGLLFARFLFSGPARAGLLHADPHPGNFRMLPDGRLGVLDFGAVDRLPDGMPPFIGRLLRLVHDGTDLGPVEQELRQQGFLRDSVNVDMEALRAFLAPMAEPSRQDRFKFSRDWLRGEAARVTDPRSSSLSRRLNLPPSYVLIHRVSTAGTGVLCQLEAEGPFRAEMIKWLPGYGDTNGAGPDGEPEGPGHDERCGRPERAVATAIRMRRTPEGEARRHPWPRLIAIPGHGDRPGAREPGPAHHRSHQCWLGPPLACGPVPSSRGVAVRSGRDVTAGSQDAGLGCDQAAFRARDPAGRLPEREDAIPLPLFVCPCQMGTVMFRRQPGVCVHGLPPFVCSKPVHLMASVLLVLVSVLVRAGAAVACASRLLPHGSSQAATSVLRGRPRGRLRGTTSPRRNSSPPQTPQGSRRSRAPAKQTSRMGHPRHRALADSTSAGSSAKNRSGSSVHGV